MADDFLQFSKSKLYFRLELKLSPNPNLRLYFLIFTFVNRSISASLDDSFFSQHFRVAWPLTAI